MKGYILNPNSDVVSKIMEGIEKKEGHCPCRVIQDDTTLCPCDDFVNNQNCVCKLFVKKED